jgi:hypothetical protein
MYASYSKHPWLLTQPPQRMKASYSAVIKVFSKKDSNRNIRPVAIHHIIIN